jgi:hypothetical protein
MDLWLLPHEPVAPLWVARLRRANYCNCNCCMLCCAALQVGIELKFKDAGYRHMAAVSNVAELAQVRTALPRSDSALNEPDLRNWGTIAARVHEPKAPSWQAGSFPSTTVLHAARLSVSATAA